MYMPIGDAFGDGHGYIEKFSIRSNFPVERVHKARCRISEAWAMDCSEAKKRDP